MTKYLLALAFSVIALTTATASDLNFTLINSTKLSFEAVYLSAISNADWDGNLLTDDRVLEPTARVAVHFVDSTKSASWDLNVVDADGLSVVFKALNLIDVETVTLKDVDGKITAEVE